MPNYSLYPGTLCWIVVPSSASLKPTPTFTIEWFSRCQPSTNNVAYWLLNKVDQIQIWVARGTYSGFTNDVVARIWANGAWRDVNGGPSDWEWSHAALVVWLSGGVYYASLFFDGARVVGPIDLTAAPAVSNEMLVIGASDDAGGDANNIKWPGQIDEMRWSNVARYDGTLTQLIIPREPFVVDGNTLALWHFDEGP